MSADQEGLNHQPEPSRALVALDTAGTVREAGNRPLATFIAQVLACRTGLPDFRARRRAEPTAAAAVYGVADGVRRSSRFQRSL